MLKGALGLVALAVWACTPQAAWAGADPAEPLLVSVVNASKPTECAEEDNVYFQFLSPQARRFAVEARQPAYLRPDMPDVQGPNFNRCTITDREDFRFTPREVTLYEDRTLLVKGFILERFWRPGSIPTTVAGRTTDGLHLIQWFSKAGGGKPFEFLVLYPADGYWRARPRPLPGVAENVYGSSFLVGPIEDKGRPIADVSAVSIEPRARRVRLTFRAGGTAVLRFGEPDRRRLLIDVALDRGGADRALPFAGLRSMFVRETNADTARILYRVGGENRLYGRDVMAFEQADARDVRFDRAVPSVHNTSAPDMLFRSFTR